MTPALDDPLHDLWIHTSHFIKKDREMVPENLRILRRTDEKCSDSRPKRDDSCIGNLESDAKGNCHDNGIVTTSLVISRSGEFEVEIGQESGQVCDQSRSSTKNIRDEGIINQGIDTSLFDQSPCVLCRIQVALAKECNLDILEN